MKIMIIGGSIGGLIAGIALADKGFDVDIYERSVTAMQDRGAGLVMQQDMMEYLMEKHIMPREVFGVPALLRQVLDERGHAALTYQNDTLFTSWSQVWRKLKAYFPAVKYFFGYELKQVFQNDTAVEATFSNGETRTADLLVGADGYNSVVRRHFLPYMHPVYAGYVAYRGLIPEKEMAKNDWTFFADKFSIYPYEHSHMLSYIVPGPHGELGEGERLYNWVWYQNKSQQALDTLLTDRDGHRRTYSVPAGFLSDSNITELRTRAVTELPAILANRVWQTKQPFVQAIFDLSVPQMYYGRVALLGDAAFVVRPHTASGTAKAYRDAVALADSLYNDGDITAALAYWNQQQTIYALALVNHGRMLAKGSQLG